MKAVALTSAGAPPKGEVSARERIPRDGKRAVLPRGASAAIGVDTVVERSGVSKTSPLSLV